MCVHPLLRLPFSFNKHIHHQLFIDVVEKSIAIIMVRSKQVSQCQSQSSVSTREHFRKPSCAKLEIAYSNCDNLVENRAWYLEIHSKVLKSSKRRFLQLSWPTLSASLSWTLFICSPVFEHSTPLFSISFTHCSWAANALQFKMDFSMHSLF